MCFASLSYRLRRCLFSIVRLAASLKAVVLNLVLECYHVYAQELRSPFLYPVIAGQCDQDCIALRIIGRHLHDGLKRDCFFEDADIGPGHFTYLLPCRNKITAALSAIATAKTPLMTSIRKPASMCRRWILVGMLGASVRFQRLPTLAAQQRHLLGQAIV